MPYSTESYLLDRANIHDTVTNLCLGYDKRSHDLLSASVFAPDVEIDYTEILGGDLISQSGSEWSAAVLEVVRDMSSMHHVVTGIVAYLPQPGEGRETPKICKVEANCLVTLVRDVRGGSIMQNGGRYELEMVKLEGVDGNPWRIRKQGVHLLWEKGNFGVFNPPRPLEKKTV